MPGPADVVRAQFEAVNRGDFQAAMDAYVDDVELLAIPPGIASGTFKGKAAVGDWFGDWFRSFATRHFEFLEVSEHGDAVALTARFIATGRQSGLELSELYYYAYWVRDGKVAKVEFCESADEALERVGLPANAP